VIVVVLALGIGCVFVLHSLGFGLNLRLFGSINSARSTSGAHRCTTIPASDFSSAEFFPVAPSSRYRVEVNEQQGLNTRSILVEVSEEQATLSWLVESEHESESRAKFALRDLRSETIDDLLRGSIVQISGELVPGDVPAKLAELIYFLYAPETMLEIKVQVL